MLEKEKFIKNLLHHFPDLAYEELTHLISENLLSPFRIPLTSDLLTQAEKFVSAAFKLRSSPGYVAHYASDLQHLGCTDPGNKSIVMSYDFHVHNGQMKLIEVNTNASFLALGSHMYESQGCPLPIKNFSMDEIRENILEELHLQKKLAPHNLSIAIVDENPPQQRLYAEFLIYQQWFKKWGWSCDIADVAAIDKDYDFIYNRATDFYFKQDVSSRLQDLFITQKSCVSPNPFEYFLLADKQRLIDWAQPGFLEKYLDPPSIADLRVGLGEAHTLNRDNAEELWHHRRQLFFKPKRAYGAKQSYKGASIARKAFEEAVEHDFIAQTFYHADEKKFLTPQGEQSFKYDLRVYAYQGRAQMILARIYQGQVTNLRTPLGGFACVEIKDPS